MEEDTKALDEVIAVSYTHLARKIVLITKLLSGVLTGATPSGVRMFFTEYVNLSLIHI